MAAKRRTLGRGLDALLTPAAGNAPDLEDELKSLPVDLLRRGKYQPRTDMRQESLEELADSIRAQGVVQPIVVRPLGPGAGYEIIAGERRWRAAQLAGLQSIPAVVRDVPDEAAVAMALIENIQREDLNPLEEARALERLIGDFQMTHQQAAEAVGRSPPGGCRCGRPRGWSASWRPGRRRRPGPGKRIRTRAASKTNSGTNWAHA